MIWGKHPNRDNETLLSSWMLSLFGMESVRLMRPLHGHGGKDGHGNGNIFTTLWSFDKAMEH